MRVEEELEIQKKILEEENKKKVETTMKKAAQVYIETPIKSGKSVQDELSFLYCFIRT